ncbi:protein snakeskin-like [Anoplophora glabripennis]|uniref:protein snakeskin-like n=1 Tax=Anoplophora glabripennis TaxID=217634 RepID=UPI000873E839|nr:protein snakeskin-like [Anoplophora glabripennis]
MAISRLSIIKFLELLIAVCCIGLHYKSRTNDFNADSLSVTAFGGYIIILIGGFAGYIMSTPINKRIDIFFSLVGCAIFVAAGALNIHIFQDYGKSEWKDYGLAKASLSIINGALFLLDSLLTWRGDF